VRTENYTLLIDADGACIMWWNNHSLCGYYQQTKHECAVCNQHVCGERSGHFPLWFSLPQGNPPGYIPTTWSSKCLLTISIWVMVMVWV